ncbi:phosphotransferase enzyme family protein [Gimesia fumaroli]|uniref:Serine/threonine protein kinase n=1 Tax=Gimesia fumaroli TaxID=2527976 RepID=A0A518I875_9PLAN|nr:phosphotransferase [Gimesia fumaroli]QDV49290.1 serine/threonine protein kinase [Gimesia fumaroli]
MNPYHLPVDDSSPYYNALAQCVDHWGLVPDKTELIRDGVNHVFATERRDGEPVIIRISDDAVRGRDEVLGELIWLEHLIRHGCTVTTPIPSRGGELLETVGVDEGAMHVSCFQRFRGRQLNPATDAEWNDELFRKLGREIGRIHRASDQMQLPADHDRLRWYEINLGQFPDPLPEIFNPQVVESMRVFTDDWIGRSTTSGHYGLVHRDLHAGNFLVEEGRIEVIDFDLGCYGWRTMDLGVLLFVYYFYPSLQVPDASPELAGHVLARLVEGYREEYTLDREQLETVGDMIMLNTVSNYFLMLPNPEHWQIAMGNPQIPVTESLAWIERLWLNGEKLQVDLKQL